MKTWSWLSLVILCVIGLPFSVKGKGNPMMPSITHDYKIYFFSGEDADMSITEDSYLNIHLKKDVGIVYDYFINDGWHVEGRVEKYDVQEGEQRYVLKHFFNGKANALLRLLDMPNCDNMKVAVIQYENEKEDLAGTFLYYILIDKDMVPY